MQYRTLGDSGLVVSDLALGTMVFDEGSPRSATAEESIAMVHAFCDAGGTHIDTANVYGGGRSEVVVGRAIAGRRDDVVLATKVRFAIGEGPNDSGLSRRHIVASVDASLARLGTDWIDLLYMHAWDPLTPLDESLRAFDDLVTAGKVRYVGVSNFAAWQVMKALGLSDASGWARFVAAQYQYNLLTRDIEWEIAELCHTEGVGIVAWGPLAGGWLAGKYERGDRPVTGRVATQPDRDEESWVNRNTDHTWAVVGAVARVAAEAGITPSQAALAWLLARPGVDSVILGVRTAEQLEDDLGASDLQLEGELLGLLDAASAVPAPYPYRFIDTYAARTL
jgi:aryl-alcohol dehydrogenase-like predicted oxidoreductase